MIIQEYNWVRRSEPVFTIASEPFVAGTIVMRNQMRAFRRRERQRKLDLLISRLCSLRGRFGKSSSSAQVPVDDLAGPGPTAATA